jgi:hypothetical protein
MTPQEAAYQAQLNRQIASLPPDIRAQVAADAIAGQKTVLPVPYWSTVRVKATRAAGPPVVLTVDTTPRKAFQYAIGGDMQVAGFTAGTSAQPCDTNLLRSGETLDNADVWIWGLAAELCSNSEPLLAAQIWRQSIVELSTNGTTSIRLGTLAMFPGSGGLYGFGRSFIAEPQLAQAGAVDGGDGASVSFTANGNPMGGNFLRFPQPFKWTGVGKGNDSSLSIIVTPNRQIAVTCAVARAAAAGIQAYTPPAAVDDLGTFVDIRFRLIAVAVGPRSQNT